MAKQPLATLFSNCNYQGISLDVYSMDGYLNLPVGWSGGVRSLKVSDGNRLEVCERPNGGGRRTSFYCSTPDVGPRLIGQIVSVRATPFDVENFDVIIMGGSPDRLERL